MRRMFRHILALAGYQIQEAADGLEALHALDSDLPDAVLLDLGLPIISGRVVREEIASQAHMRLIPVIVVTGEPGDHAELDAACVLRKPVSPERLLRTVSTCLAAGAAAPDVASNGA